MSTETVICHFKYCRLKTDTSGHAFSFKKTPFNLVFVDPAFVTGKGIGVTGDFATDLHIEVLKWLTVFLAKIF